MSSLDDGLRALARAGGLAAFGGVSVVTFTVELVALLGSFAK